MSLPEVLVASCLLLGCLSGSLQLWAFAVGISTSEEHRQLLRERVEAELIGSESRLRHHSRALSPAADCLAQGRSLLAALAARPVPGGLRRQLRLEDEGPLLAIRVDAEGLAEPRQRLWSPAAFGLCATAAPPATTPEP
jgi:hypothetical protein